MAIDKVWSRLALALVVGLLLASTPVEARTMQQRMREACAADVAILCPDVTNDPDRLKACMLNKRVKVTPDCMRLIDASE